MQRRASLGLTEKPIADAMGDEEGPKWPSLRRMHPNSTAGAPNGQFGFKTHQRRSSCSVVKQSLVWDWQQLVWG